MTESTRRKYQLLVFTIVFTLGFFSDTSIYFLLGLQDCYLVSFTDYLCHGIRYSIVVCAGVGFIFWGNIYDNFNKPRLLTTYILVLLAAISFLEALYILKYRSVKKDPDDLAVFTIY